MIYPVQIYLNFTKTGSRIIIHQTSKLLTGEIFLERKRYVRKPYEKHMRIGLGGVINKTIIKHKKNYNKKITHIGIHLSHPIALDVLEKNVTYISDKRNIKIFIFDK